MSGMSTTDRKQDNFGDTWKKKLSLISFEFI